MASKSLNMHHVHIRGDMTNNYSHSLVHNNSVNKIFVENNRNLQQQISELQKEMLAKDAEIMKLTKMLHYSNSQVKVVRKVTLDINVKEKVVWYVKKFVFKKMKFVHGEEFMSLSSEKDANNNYTSLGMEIISYLRKDVTLGVPELHDEYLVKWWYPYR